MRMAKNFGLSSFVYVITYIIALASTYMSLTAINGSALYDFAPTIDYRALSIEKSLVLFSVFINIILFILFNTSIWKSCNKYNFMIFVCLFISIFIGKLLQLPVITTDCLLFYLLILNAYLINNRLFLKINLLVQFVIMLVIISAYYLHLFPSSNTTIFYRHNTYRYTLGFVYPTILASAVLGLILSFIFLYYESRSYIYKFVFLICIGSIGSYFYYITDTRGLRLSVIVILILLIFGSNKKFRNIIYKYVPYLIIFSLVASYLILIYYKHSLPYSYQLNNLMSGRLSLESTALKSFPIKLLGGNVLPMDSVYNNAITVDNGFIDFLIKFGVLGTIFYEYFFVRSSFIARKNKNYLLCCILITLLTQFFFETDYDKSWFIMPMIYAFSINYRTLEQNDRKTKSF